MRHIVARSSTIGFLMVFLITTTLGAITMNSGKIKNPVLNEEMGAQLLSCLVCKGKVTFGYYGRWGERGTCSRKCELTMEENRHAYSSDRDLPLPDGIRQGAG